MAAAETWSTDEEETGVAKVVVLTALTLSAYYYVWLFRSLRRLELRAADEQQRKNAVGVRGAILLGIGLQIVAILFLATGVAALLSDPFAQESLTLALETGELNLPSSIVTAETLARLFDWASWLVLWVPLVAFLSGALQRHNSGSRAIGVAWILIAVRIVEEPIVLLSGFDLARGVNVLNPLLYLALVGATVAAWNALWTARAYHLN
ncbi:MAG: hypothetical protein FJ144_15815 [Deltaproteobacteria bacterium]|nr:hypothetical protein [Deltaproteobacteria bacterium]